MLVMDRLEIKVLCKFRVLVFGPLSKIFVEAISFKINSISDWPLNFFLISGNEHYLFQDQVWLGPSWGNGKQQEATYSAD